MALDDLTGVIEELQDMIGKHRDYLSEDETRTRQVLIDPLLRELGWDVSDPDMVHLEYRVKQQRADYALMSNGRPVAVIEAKRLGKSLKDDYMNQVLNYANLEGIRYMIVTDGDRWEMYEVFKPVALEERQLMKFQLSQQPAHENALQALRIWKPNLASGSPSEAMEPVIESPQPAPDSSSSPSNEPQSSPDNPPKDSTLTPTKPSTKQLYREYWTALRTHLDERNGVIEFSRTPQAVHWMPFAVFDRPDFRLLTSTSVRNKWMRVELQAKGENGKPYFHRLKQDRVEIEKEIGADLEWRENPVEHYIGLYQHDADPQNRQDWDRQHQWLCEQLETFHKVFAPRIQALNTSDYQLETEEIS